MERSAIRETSSGNVQTGWRMRHRSGRLLHPSPASEASGGEGGERSEPGGGTFFICSAGMLRAQGPPTPDPSPPFATRMGGGELRDLCMLKGSWRRISRIEL